MDPLQISEKCFLLFKKNSRVFTSRVMRNFPGITEEIDKSTALQKNVRHISRVSKPHHFLQQLRLEFHANFETRDMT